MIQLPTYRYDLKVANYKGNKMTRYIVSINDSEDGCRSLFWYYILTAKGFLYCVT